MVEVRIFGKHDCARCDSTKKKVAFFLDKWELSNSVEMVFFDMDSVEGRAEGAFHDVNSVPTTILNDGSSNVVRWEGAVPDSGELRAGLQGGQAIS